MEKRIAHYNLDSIKKLIQNQQYRITGTAYKDAIELGFDEKDILNAVLSLTNKNLYKSMTTIVNHKIWQDVYYTTSRDISLYVKLQINEDAIIISFKENT